MSQTWNTDVYDKDLRTADDVMNDIESMLDTLKSSFSGSAAPSNPVAFMLWGDTTLGDECLKRRNDANDAWLAVLSGDASQKMWIYRNDTCEGWVIDATVTDRVLAVNGGTNAYNVNGGVNAGTWTQPGHTLAESEIPAHSHGSGGAHVHTIEAEGAAGGLSNRLHSSSWANGGRQPISTMINSGGDHIHTSVGGGSSHNHGDTYRPAAAVGTLQYPDL